MWISGLIILGCFGSVGAVVGLLVLASFGPRIPLGSAWGFVMPTVFFFYFAWKFGLRFYSPVFARLRRVPMQVDWEKRYGSSFLMPDAPWGKVGEECAMTGMYQVFRGEREILKIERGEFFPLANVERRPHNARWEMVEYPLSPGWFLLGIGLVQRVQMVERQRKGKDEVLSLDGSGG